MFDELIRRHQAPLVERLAELEAELEDLRRRSENHARIGVITEVDPAGLCKVSHGDLMTPGIKWFNPSAGKVAETLIPSVGEQCVLINYGGGDGGAHTVALRGLTSDAFPPASVEPQLHRRTYPDGTESSYDHDSHVLAWKNGGTAVTASREIIELMIEVAKLTMTPESVLLMIGDTKLSMTPETALLTIGEVSAELEPGGIHFTGPLITHNGRTISTG